MIILIKLILAHFIGDFVLQPKSWVKNKEQLKLKSSKFYWHIIIHGVLILLILWDWHYWLLALILMLAHGMIDILKLYLQKENNKSAWFIADQALHFGSIILLWLLWFQPNLKLKEYFEQINIWIFITAILFITIVAGIMIKVLLEKWSNNLMDGNDGSLNNAGKYIGILERLFVFTFIITGNWSAIGFLLAAKSVFRFGDLKESKDRKLTEYILIGTLFSFGIAIAVGLVVLKLIKQ